MLCTQKNLGPKWKNIQLMPSRLTKEKVVFIDLENQRSTQALGTRTQLWG
jgi:hypothetical protein